MTGDGHAEFDFAKYNIKIYGDDKDVYFPESTLSDIFTDLVYHYSVCNGETFYFNFYFNFYFYFYFNGFFRFSKKPFGFRSI